MRKECWLGIAVVVALGIATGGCSSVAYKQYLKPYVDKVGAFVEKYRDPECLSEECAWKEEVFIDKN